LPLHFTRCLRPLAPGSSRTASATQRIAAQPHRPLARRAAPPTLLCPASCGIHADALDYLGPDRPLQHINKKGRPVTQCSHCRSMRKSRASHIKCDCGEKTHKCVHLTVDGHKGKLPYAPRDAPTSLVLTCHVAHIQTAAAATTADAALAHTRRSQFLTRYLSRILRTSVKPRPRAPKPARAQGGGPTRRAPKAPFSPSTTMATIGPRTSPSRPRRRACPTS
jgi:hypothetical protein